MSDREPELDALAPAAAGADAPDTPGIHHVSVVSGDPHGNLTFYRETLGLRLVKRTVNHDEPAVHHLYYGDREGTPGTTFTSFPYPLDPGGRPGAGQPGETGFAIPEGSLDYWQERLDARGVEHGEPTERFGERVLTVADPDGLALALVESADAGRLGVDGLTVEPWGETVPQEHAIRGIHSTTLRSKNPFVTARVLELLGFGLVGQEGERVRYVAGVEGVESEGLDVDTGPLAREPTPGTVIDLYDREEAWGKEGAGTGHHVALRVPDREALDAWHERLTDAGLSPSRPRERYYFESVYVRDPGGVLFELATDGPGLTRDEPVADLGSDLRVPPWLADDEAMLREQLPPLDEPVRREATSDAARAATTGGER